MRKLLVVAAACSTFGGVVGALAAGATQSQASSTALARAAQRVEDTNAEATLRTISSRLGTVDSRLSAIDLYVRNTSGNTSATNTSVTDGDNGIDLLLAQICDESKVQNDEPLCSTPTGDSAARLSRAIEKH